MTIADENAKDTSLVEVMRLKKRADFLQARNGARSHGRAFVLQGYKKPDGEANIRVGYTVTKKVGNAVERNRIRRRLREAIVLATESEQTSASLAGYDIVVIARRVALKLPFDQLVGDLEKGLKQLVAKKTPKGQKRRNNPPSFEGNGDTS